MEQARSSAPLSATEKAQAWVVKKRKYRPLDVKSWYEGSLQLIGWILVIVLAVVTGALWVIYELYYLNVHDADFRDLYFDQRITNFPNNYYHKNFLLAETCCNRDPVVYPYTLNTNTSTCSSTIADTYEPAAPYCKPIIIMECVDSIRSAACNSTRTALYGAVGLSLTGQYTNCLQAGRVRVGAQAVAAGRPTTLVANYRGSPTDTLVIYDPFDINKAELRAFVDSVANSVNASDVAYVQPSTTLSNSVYLEERKAAMRLRQLHGSVRGVKAPPPWNKVSNLWPWPGMNKRCTNTAVRQAYQLAGSVTVGLPVFRMDAPQNTMLRLQVANDSILVPAYNVTATGTGYISLPNKDNKALSTVSNSSMVAVGRLAAILVFTGQTIQLGNCYGWRLSRDLWDVQYNYTIIWRGPVEELQAGLTFGPFLQTVNVFVQDVAGPRQISLFFYGGMWYIWNAFFMAFIWMVSTALMLFTVILVWWNIRSNKGLPPIVYRYMRKYRGW